MPWKPPVLKDLSKCNSKVSRKVWETYIIGKNGLYWSIILSYLIPSAHSQSHGDFAKRLKNLTGDSIGCFTVMDNLKHFNPFHKKHAFYFGTHMRRVLRKFKKNVNRNMNFRPAGANTVDLTLAAAAEMLNCFIEVYHAESTEIQKSDVFSPEAQSVSFDVNPDTLIIFHRPKTHFRSGENYTFGFGLLDGIIRHQGVLDIYWGTVHLHLYGWLLGVSLIKDNGEMVRKAFMIWENFLVLLLQSDIKSVIPKIYKFKSLLELLKDYGYNTNPLVKGRDGFSAFHLCLSLPDPQYLNLLYNYVSTNFYQSGVSCRKPGDETLLALNDLKRVFSRIPEKMSPLTEIAAYRHREISRFNVYQINVVKILKDQQKSADDTVLAILKEYIKYFSSCDERIHFENYIKFGDYYEKLDNYTCILILDRLAFLKNKAYFDLVQPLFLMMMSNNYFPRKEHDHDGGTPLGCKGCAHRVIPLKYRMNFLKVLKEVCNQVRTVSGGNIASPADMILRSVQSIPKDEFILSRLKTSLEAAINVQVNDTKSVQKIFRTIQVLGEVFATSINENFVSGFLLSAHIPLEIEQALRDIRNDISHYKANAIQGRLNLEMCIDLFQKIQDELKLIYQVLTPVFSCQRFKMKEFIIQSATPHFQISEDEIKNISIDREIWCTTQWDQFKTFAVNVFRFFEKVLNKSFPKMNGSENYFEKIKRLQDGIDALNFVFSFKITFDDAMVTKNLTDARAKLQKIIKILKLREPTCHDIKYLKVVFKKYVLLLKDIFSLEVTDASSDVKCENLIHLKNHLKNYNVFVGDENLEIRKLISEFLKPSFEATVKLKTALRNSQKPPNLDQVLQQTYLSNKNRKIIKATFLSNPSENLKILESYSYDSMDKALGKELETSKKLLEMLTKEEYKKALLQHSSTFERSLEIKFLKLVNQKMEFLIKRIYLIDNILFGPNCKNVRLDIMMPFPSLYHQYEQKLDVKSSLEMLLFDCMNIMDKRKDLSDLYTKMNNMFAGVDLRNILSHGNILVDTLGILLDPGDFLSELDAKMLELIEDQETLRALSDFWMEHKPNTTEDLKKLIKIHNQSENVADIIKCHRWESYAVILPTRQ
ncbi:hypothetical protein AVEN_215162-1 [Araneus ventricosus]|uniref:Uncharacterized protein n=1 Tax=Araneus ventricosus TaxID=182803 RepID=A0A4Y2FR92_ARAVE|nr:hypothetical protein AVEN_215162-1 [Araneus ventricosus]